MRTSLGGMIGIGAMLGAAAVCSAVEVGPLLETLRAVGPQGKGHPEAQQAWQKLAAADASQLPADINTSKYDVSIRLVRRE